MCDSATITNILDLKAKVHRLMADVYDAEAAVVVHREQYDAANETRDVAAANESGKQLDAAALTLTEVTSQYEAAVAVLEQAEHEHAMGHLADLPPEIQEMLSGMLESGGPFGASMGGQMPDDLKIQVVAGFGPMPDEVRDMFDETSEPAPQRGGILAGLGLGGLFGGRG